MRGVKPSQEPPGRFDGIEVNRLLQRLRDLREEIRKTETQIQMHLQSVCNEALIRYPDPLTPRQQQVFDLSQRGFTIKEISAQLGIGERVTKFHISRLLKKARVRTRYEL